MAFCGLNSSFKNQGAKLEGTFFFFYLMPGQKTCTTSQNPSVRSVIQTENR